MNIKEFLVEKGIFKKPEISNFNLNLHRDCYITDQHNIERAMKEVWNLAVEKCAEDTVLKIEYSDGTNRQFGDFTRLKEKLLKNKID